MSILFYGMESNLFWYRPAVSAFWSEVQKMCNARKLCFKLDFFSVMFGELTETSGSVINLIVL